MSKSKNDVFIVQGDAVNLDWFENRNQKINGEDWFWTVPKGAHREATVFVYLTAPVSRIVGRLKILDEPFENVGNVFDNDRMNGKWCAQVEFAEYYQFKEEITYKGLKKLFYDDWGWIRYPRGNCRVPGEIAEPLCRLLNFKRKK